MLASIQFVKRIPIVGPVLQLLFKPISAFRQRRAQREYRKRFAQPLENVFTEHFKENFWGNPESVSGDGSTRAYTDNIRKALPGLFESLNVHTILDAPCGDFNWFRLLPRQPQQKYVGGDIVSELIDRNKQFENENTKFVRLDVTRDPLPKADLWLCRDLLFHLSYSDIWRALNNFAKSEITYLLTTSHPECAANGDILSGDFRELNLQLEPFLFPEPKVEIDDWIEGYPVRKLCLWRRDDLADVLSTARTFSTAGSV